jgi:hypothetical protein
MKYLAIIVFLLFFGAAKSQTEYNSPPIDSVTNSVLYRYVFESQNTKDVLYDLSLEWVISVFNNSNYTIRLNDKESGKIICKGSFICIIPMGIFNEPIGTIDFTLSIVVKDFKCKIEIFDVSHDNIKDPIGGDLSDEKPDYAGMGYKKSLWPKIKHYADAEIISIIKSYYAKINTKVDNDW